MLRAGARVFGMVVCVVAAVVASGCDDDDDGGGGVDARPDTGLPDGAAPDGVVVVPETGVEAAPMPPRDAGPIDAVTATARKIPTQGSAVAITADDKYAVAVNRTAGRVTVFKLDFGGTYAALKSIDLDVGKAAEPWAVVIGNDDDSAYVILRKDQRVVRIRNLRTAPWVDDAYARTGSEPTGLAISPTGARLYVANWAEGTVTVVETATLNVAATIDLNPALAGSMALGAGVAPRPGMAHPRAVVVSNNGDASDADERVYVTEFFSQARTDALPDDDSRFDVGRQGLVYHFDVATGTVAAPISIKPVADTGFVDSKGGVTGCFPNQLYAAAINTGRLYVTSVCESPRGPTGPDMVPVAPGVGNSNFKTQIHGAIFVVDLATNAELPAQGLLLTREFDKLYTTLALAADDAARRLPLIPNDIMFAAGTTFAYVTGYGSDAVFRIAYKPDGTLERVGAATQPFINLKPAGTVAAGELPVGLASANAGASITSFALAINENSRNLSVLSFGTQTTVDAVPATDAPTPADVPRNRGRKFFVTGLGRWSLNGQAWNSCEACHPDGLTDNVTWFFGRGPRQTTSLDASYNHADPTQRRVLNWTGIFDEVHDFELNTRGNSGGVGAIVHRAGPPVIAADRIIFDGAAIVADQQATPTPQANLSGSTISLMPKGTAMPKSLLPDWDEIDEYVKAIRAPRAPSNLAAGDVAAGKVLFDANGCAACHGSAHFTIAKVFFTPNEDNNKVGGLLQTTLYTRPTLFPAALNPPSAPGMASLRISPASGATDQINCVLRDVGTFPAAGTVGIAPAGVVVKEVRQDMTTPAQGVTGFNIPSLLGMVTGAPYFHGGGARTLEEALGETFDRHRRAFAENFRPDVNQTRQLTAYLLSIDETTAAPPAPNLGFPFDLCSQIPAGIIK